MFSRFVVFCEAASILSPFQQAVILSRFNIARLRYINLWLLFLRYSKLLQCIVPKDLLIMRNPQLAESMPSTVQDPVAMDAMGA